MLSKIQSSIIEDMVGSNLWLFISNNHLEQTAYIIANVLAVLSYILIAIIIFYTKCRTRQDHYISLCKVLMMFCALGVFTCFLDLLYIPTQYPLYLTGLRLLLAATCWVSLWYLLKEVPVLFSLRSQREMEEEIQAKIDAEAALKVNNERLLDAEKVAKLGYGFWDVVRDRIELSDNALRILGMPPGSILTLKLLMEQIHPADTKYVLENLRKNTDKEEQQQIYFRIVTPAMEVKHLLLKGENLINEANKTVMVRIVLQDVSEIRRYMRRVELQNKKLKKIAWIQSHRMRSPIATIMGMASLINEDDPNDPINKEVLSNIKAESRRLDDLILEVEHITRQKLS